MKIVGEKDVKAPAFFCESCEHRTGNRCDIYDRLVIPEINRCFHHSNYSPVVTKEDI